MLAGRSNVGKSTLLNALVGSKVAIVTPKAQTTRHPIRGVLHDRRGQLVFVDTPGVFLGRKDTVSKRLNEFVKETLEGVDAVVYVMDPTRAPGEEEEEIRRLLRAVRVPVIALINKTDVRPDAAPFLEAYRAADVGQRTTIEASAATRKNLNRLVDALFNIAPEGPAHYPDLQITDLEHARWLEEIVREKVFLRLEKEVPYSIKVTVDHVENRKDGSRFVQATIWTDVERFKGMIIGAKGAMLKRIGTDARKEIEAATGAKTFLELTVKVDPKWQERFV